MRLLREEQVEQQNATDTLPDQSPEKKDLQERKILQQK